jgi:hypothetical protein
MHIRVILDKHLQGAKESAESLNMTALCGLIETLHTKSLQLDTKLTNNLVPPLQREEVHELLHEVQEFAVDMFDNQNFTDQDSAVADFTDQVSAYL